MSHGYIPTRVQGPAEPVVTLAEAKAHCGVLYDTDDARLELLIEAQTARLDGFDGLLRRCLVEQTWRQTYDQFCSEMRLPFPAISIASVRYLDPNGVEQTVDPSIYALRRTAAGSFVCLQRNKSWPAQGSFCEAVSISFAAGYGAAADVPASLKIALLIMVGDAWANPEGDQSGDQIAETMMRWIRPHRLVGV